MWHVSSQRDVGHSRVPSSPTSALIAFAINESLVDFENSREAFCGSMGASDLDRRSFCSMEGFCRSVDASLDPEKVLELTGADDLDDFLKYIESVTDLDCIVGEGPGMVTEDVRDRLWEAMQTPPPTTPPPTTPPPNREEVAMNEFIALVHEADVHALKPEELFQQLKVDSFRDILDRFHSPDDFKGVVQMPVPRRKVFRILDDNRQRLYEVLDGVQQQPMSRPGLPTPCPMHASAPHEDCESCIMYVAKMDSIADLKQNLPAGTP